MAQGRPQSAESRASRVGPQCAPWPRDRPARRTRQDVRQETLAPLLQDTRDGFLAGGHGHRLGLMEKDATVDYLRPVIDFAATTGAYVIFRNQVPALSLVEHIPSRRPPAI